MTNHGISDIIGIKLKLKWGEPGMDEILAMLERDGRLDAEHIAVALGREEADVRAAIEEYEENGTILKYTALINKDNLDEEHVTALIEVKISPQKGDGYDRIAQRIYQYDEVDSLYLMTGSYDLLVSMTVKTMKEAAVFVYEHLAAIEGVSSTATRFIMKKYKEQNCVFVKRPEQEEGGIFI